MFILGICTGVYTTAEQTVTFLTVQERDGCVNVLNSYKLDSGVDGIMRELLLEVSPRACCCVSCDGSDALGRRRNSWKGAT